MSFYLDYWVFSDVADCSGSVPNRCSPSVLTLLRPESSVFCGENVNHFHFWCTLLVATVEWLFGRPTQWSFPVQMISGAIPESFGYLSNITTLDLSSNKLTGESPGCTDVERLWTAISYFSLHHIRLAHISLVKVFRPLNWQCRAYQVYRTRCTRVSLHCFYYNPGYISYHVMAITWPSIFIVFTSEAEEWSVFRLT